MSVVSDPDDSVFKTVAVCAAHNGSGIICGGLARTTCSTCLLVPYCSDECQRDHWPEHKGDCPGIKGNLGFPQPSKGFSEAASASLRSCWAPSPAFDIINLEKNEGDEFDGTLHLLFAGEFGLRNFIYSVVKLPPQSQLKLNITIAESWGYTNLARTIVGILLLCSSHSIDLGRVAEAVIHYWYSAKLPKHVWTMINERANKPVIEQIYKTKQDLSKPEGEHGPAELKKQVFDFSFLFETHLQPDDWFQVLHRMEMNNEIKPGDAMLTRILDIQRHGESWQRAAARMTPARAMGLHRWRADGILLPFSHPREEHDLLNPLFFGCDVAYPTKATSEPLSEWPMELLDNKDSPASNDVYGKMFYYLRETLVEFQHRIQNMEFSITLFPSPVDEIPRIPSPDAMLYDRIELGSAWHNGPLVTMVPALRLLRHVDESPFATLVTMSQETVTDPTESVIKDTKREKALLTEASGTALDELAPPLQLGQQGQLRDVIRRQMGLVLWRNWDRFSEHYVNSHARFNFGKMLPIPDDIDCDNIFKTGFMGLKLKKKHTIVRRWPIRLVHSKSDKPSMEAFERYIGWPVTAPERMFEWQNSATLPEEIFLPSLMVALSQFPMAHGVTVVTARDDTGQKMMRIIPDEVLDLLESDEEESDKTVVDAPKVDGQQQTKAPDDGPEQVTQNEAAHAETNGVEETKTEDEGSAVSGGTKNKSKSKKKNKKKGGKK